MPTQVQIRGTTQTTQEARTLVSRELDVNTTDGRLCVHNGSDAGGVPHLNYKDEINQEFTYAAASGTNALTISLAKAPAAYQAGQKFVFKAAATNTASATINVDSLGAKTIKKKDVATGTLTTLSAGDIISGGIYAVYYDGTDMILESVDSAGLQSVSQGDLNTSTGSVSMTTSATSVTLPGGEYGFFPQLKSNIAAGTVLGVSYSKGTSYATKLAIYFVSATAPGISGYGGHVSIGFAGGSSINGGADYAYAQQRYITSSPPYNMGDGEVGGFVFVVVDNTTGDVVSHYSADVPPWAYNGPTSIRADKKDAAGRKYRRVPVARNEKGIIDLSTLLRRPVQALSDLAAEDLAVLANYDLEESYELITQDIKNRDMDLIPHPFDDIGPGKTILLLDPMDSLTRRLVAMQNDGADISSMIAGSLAIDNEPLTRKGPKGVKQVKYSLK